MKQLLKNLSLFLLFPAIIVGLLLIGYFIYDPFKLIHKYDIDEIATVTPNRDYVSTETFLKHYPEQKYNSFVFGSSRSLAYNPDKWKEYIGKDTRPFSFDASKENIEGIFHKLMFLDTRNIDIKNALILIDTDENYFQIDKKEHSHLIKKHPVTLNNTFCEWFDFHKVHFLAYMNPRYLVSLYGYEIFGIDNALTQLHRSTSIHTLKYPYNWIDSSEFDNFLDENPDYFDSDMFYERSENPQILKKQIHEKQTEILLKVKEILNRHNTDYRIIINPLYDQRKFIESDIQVLRDIFGEEYVYDFSGKNRITESKYNYYEESHFRIGVGNSIIKYIYQSK